MENILFSGGRVTRRFIKSINSPELSARLATVLQPTWQSSPINFEIKFKREKHEGNISKKFIELLDHWSATFFALLLASLKCSEYSVTVKMFRVNQHVLCNKLQKAASEKKLFNNV